MAKVYAGDFPDPFVLVADARRRGGVPREHRHFAFGTQTGSINLQVMLSHDLNVWDRLGDALPRLPAWAEPGRTWAPAVLGRPDGYVMYYAVRHRAAGRQCLSLATASRPEGPFVDTSAAPFVFQDDRGGSIDPSPFVDGDGTAYLLWKSDDNALGRPTSLWGARLTADGLTLAEAPVEVLRQDQAWEAPAIEAPSLVFAGGAYHLFYSAGPWESASYCVGYATGDAPLGPFRKESPRPWMTSRQEAAGPGGAEVFTDASGSLRIAYHAWTPPNIGYGAGGVRSLWIDRLRFVGGRPVLDESTNPQTG